RARRGPPRAARVEGDRERPDERRQLVREGPRHEAGRLRPQAPERRRQAPAVVAQREGRRRQLLGLLVHTVQERGAPLPAGVRALPRPGRVRRCGHVRLLAVRFQLPRPLRRHVPERARPRSQRARQVRRAAHPADVRDLPELAGDRIHLRRGARGAARRRDPGGAGGMRRAALAVALLVLVAVPVAGASENHPTLAELEGEIMCPVCDTTLDQSSSPVARQIKVLISQRIAAGDSKQEIKDLLVAQYGTKILAAPPKKGFNLLAWLLPIALLLGGAVVLGVLAWRWSHTREPGPPAAQLSPALERRVDEELARYDEG